MTSQRDFERLLDQWFAEGPDEVNDRVIDEVAERMEHQPQQLAWRASWRDSHVNAYFKPLAAIAAVIAVAVVGITMFGGRTSPNIGVGSSPSPSHSIAPSVADLTPVPTSPWWVSPDDLGRPCGDGPDQNGCAGELSAGTHQSVGLVPPMRFTVPAGWINTQAWAQWYTLMPDTPATRAGVEERITLIPDFALMESSCEDTQPENSPASSAEIMAAIEAIEGVQTRAARPVTIGRLSGQWVDLQLSAAWTGTCPDAATTPAAPVLGERLTRGARFRFIVLDAPGGRNILIKLIAADQAAFESLTTEGLPIVETFEFDFGPAPS
jgi:hypothetical protein